jgi:murein DD-endopeptidase MepM/ murein hydrolase activator NlpD
VLSAGAGVVVYAGTLADRGVVSVDHAGGLRTTYEPLAAAVRAGQLVRRGEALGTLAAGHSGCPAPACLHWGLRRDREYLDPLLLVRPAHVRLLPWAPDP